MSTSDPRVEAAAWSLMNARNLHPHMDTQGLNEADCRVLARGMLEMADAALDAVPAPDREKVAEALEPDRAEREARAEYWLGLADVAIAAMRGGDE